MTSDPNEKLAARPKSSVTRAFGLAGLCSLWVQVCGAGTVATTLNLVNEPGVNELAISLAIPQFETGNDTTNLSGTADATLQIDPATGVITQLTFTGGSVSGTPITLAGNSTLGINPGSYSFSSTVLSGVLNTITPPGPVDNAPGPGDFASSRHEVIINGGVLSGLLSSLFVNETINQDFGASPVTAQGSGIGTVNAVFRADLSNQTTSVYDLVVFIGVASSNDVLVGSTTVVFGASGTIKLAGQVSVPYLPLIFNFSPNPQIVVDGSTLDMDYNAEGADSSSIDQGVGPLNPPVTGTKIVDPPDSTDTTYTFTASNGNGSVMRSTTVRSVAQGSATYRYVRFTPVRLKGDLPGIDPADSIQLSEFQFYDGPTEHVPLSATNPGGANPAGEGPDKLIDGNAGTKWLDFNKGCVIFDFGSATTIDNYRFTTANDSEERDPVAWILEGSDGLAAWTTIEAITVRQDDFGQEFNYFTPVARQAVTQFLPIPAVPTVPSAVITEFSSSPQIVLDANSTSLGWDTVSAATLEIDNGIGTVTGDSGSIAVNPPNATDTKYTLTAGNAAGQEVEAEVLVRSVSQGSASYRYLRFTPVRLAETLPGFGAANSVQLADFEFINGVIPVPPVAVTNPEGNSPPGEEAGNLLDGNPGTKWLDFNKEGLVFDFGSPTAITAYRWTTGADEPSRDPVAWSLEGSDDGTTWNLVDNVNKSRANPGEDIAIYAGLPRGATTPPIPVPTASSLLPLIAQFVGDAPFLVLGEPLVLSWETSGATSVSIDQTIGTVALTGTATAMPTFDTTYTLTATSPSGSVTAQFSTTVVTPSLDRIFYPGFDAAGDELALLQNAMVVNDFGNIPLPGDFDRLRVTSDIAGTRGAAWFRKRVDLSQGFRSWMDFHFLAGSNSGADQLSFVIQNSPEGTAVDYELQDNAVRIRFDSYLNGGEPSAGFVQVIDGTNVLATVDLTTIGGITLPGTVPNDLSSDDFNVAPYKVRIAYVPGDLDIFFDGVLVIDSLNLDLSTTGALDGDGKAYVGFFAETGEFHEHHDVTRWILTEGPPASSLAITDLSVDLVADTAVFTFSSSEGESYSIFESVDCITFNPLATGVPGAMSAEETTTDPIGFVGTPRRFFRIELETP